MESGAVPQMPPRDAPGGGIVTSLSRSLPYLLCAIAAVVLASPGFRFPYLFDDYDFIGRAQLFRITSLAPDAGLLFYRPLSREVYSWILELISPGSAVGGHLLNALVLAATVVLGGTLASRLAGTQAGIVAGLLIATFAHWPVLVGWVCGACHQAVNTPHS